jgi:hypothetical protein
MTQEERKTSLEPMVGTSVGFSRNRTPVCPSRAAGGRGGMVYKDVRQTDWRKHGGWMDMYGKVVRTGVTGAGLMAADWGLQGTRGNKASSWATAAMGRVFHLGRNSGDRDWKKHLGTDLMRPVGRSDV